MKTSCVKHPKRGRLVIIHEWQLAVCDGNACAAALLSFLEYWHNIKTEQVYKAQQAFDIYGEKNESTTLWQFHTEEDLEQGVLIYKRTAIAVAVKLLESKGFIRLGRNPNPRYSWDRTRFFLLIPEVVNKAVAALSEDPGNGAASTENGSLHPPKTTDMSTENGSTIP